MTIKSDPRLFSAKERLSVYFCQLKFPSRKLLNARVDWTREKGVKWSRLCKLSLGVVILKTATLRKNNLWKIPRAFVIPLAQKTSFQHSNLYLESAGCVSSYTVLISGPILLLLTNTEKSHTSYLSANRLNTEKWENKNRITQTQSTQLRTLCFQGNYWHHSCHMGSSEVTLGSGFSPITIPPPPHRVT